MFNRTNLFWMAAIALLLLIHWSARSDGGYVDQYCLQQELKACKNNKFCQTNAYAKCWHSFPDKPKDKEK